MKPSKLEIALLKLTIFLIPSNLAFHFLFDQNYVSGILVDYLIPKLYLSDISLLAILISSFYRNRTLFKLVNIKKYFNKNIALLITCCFLLALRNLFTPHPLASIWFLLKITEFSLFYIYLRSHIKLPLFLKEVSIPLTLSLLFQSLLGLYQFLTQTSLYGFHLLGESTLKMSGNVAKDLIFGSIRLLPYGTTPHPNVLSGYIVFSIIMLTLFTQKRINNHLIYILNLITILLSSIVVIIIDSTSTLLGLLGILMAIIAIKYISNIYTNLSAYLISIIILVLTMLPIYNSYQTSNTFDNASITRRYRLLNTSYQLISNPAYSRYDPLRLPITIFGVGLNQFTAYLPHFSPISTDTAFLQPVHNIYILYLVETGFMGILLLYIVLTKPGYKAYFPQSLPLILLLVIGSLDHYPFTLQTGQILFTLALYIASKR